MSAKTMADEWNTFEARVVPANAHPIQRREMRRAFYSGAYAMLAMALRASELTEDAGADRLSEWLAEIEAYFASEFGLVRNAHGGS